MLRLLTILLLFAAPTWAADVFPLAEVRAGQRGVGKTVFEGTAIEEFDVEILGVLEGVGPKQSLILGRLSGGPLERTGVMAGMSGSPVYVDGRLLGAVAFSFAFSKEPLCGIRPIEEMLAAGESGPAEARARAVDLAALRSGEQPLLPVAEQATAGGGMLPIMTPVAFGGFSARTLETFGETLRGLGLRPMQGVGGKAANPEEGPLEPGSMISVGLIRGDMNAVASGTVTAIEGERVYGFGHAFLQSGPALLPMMRASVMALVPSVESSFKLAGTGAPLGRISMDRSAAVIGEIGAEPDMVPVSIVVRESGTERAYRMEVARDAYLTPFLLQMATFGALDVTERQIGPSTLRVSGRALMQGAPAIDLGDVYASASGSVFEAAAGAAGLVAFVLQTAPEEARVEAVEIEVDAEPRAVLWRVTEAWAEKTEVRPGETVALSARLLGPGGTERVITENFRVPEYLGPTQLAVSFSDAMRLNVLDFPLLIEAHRLSAGELVGMVNRLRRSDGLFLRAERGGASYRFGGRRLAGPPASFRATLESTAAAKEPTEAVEERVVWRADGEVEGKAEIRLMVVE